MHFKRGLLYLLAVLIFAGTFFTGYLFGHQNLKFEESFVPKLVNTELSKPREIDFSLFWEAWDLLGKKYIGSINIEELVFGAIRGMVAAVGDPYTVFMPPGESESFLEDLAGRFDGIGAEIAIREGKLIVVSPLEGSPAKEAGLKPKDWIVAINDEPTDSMSIGEATQKIRGKAGTLVKLTVVATGSREPHELTVRRATIKVESVQLSYKKTDRGENIAYLKIIQFGPETADTLKKMADEILARKASGIIVDVRNNPGGYLDAAIDATSLLISEEVIVKEKKKDGSVQTLSRTLSARLADLPLVVLINEGSASASEIMAGAIQDHQRGKVIGEKSFGKGSVQDLERLKGGSSLRVTVAKWLTPAGREIDQEGITPDIEVKRSDADVTADRDPQLLRALEELTR